MSDRTVPIETFLQMQRDIRSIVNGMTSAENQCWPTRKPWTKKERDEAITEIAKRLSKAINELPDA